ncbi:hypothetical protein JRQ81_011363 [Phrynocephalus forsythii]|uniref:Latent transforming growth factor beta binding protein 3 n=1 Tax=Phrynocephalus forsythii TaxID=171643 RepID=A0A9Q1APZ6_9SAUR|nr:hypothetical protein JRQ81_011363 [Phrynocephalus forsythii]
MAPAAPSSPSPSGGRFAGYWLRGRRGRRAGMGAHWRPAEPSPAPPRAPAAALALAALAAAAAASGLGGRCAPSVAGRMRPPPALSALCLLATLLLLLLLQMLAAALGAQGPRRPPGDSAAAALRPPAPNTSSGPRGTPAQEKRRKKPAGRAPNACGDACCPGWSLAPKTGKCTKAVCTPRCRNGGQCKAPQRCTCHSGFAGPRCEHSMPTATTPTLMPSQLPGAPLKAGALRWQPLTSLGFAAAAAAARCASPARSSAAGWPAGPPGFPLRALPAVAGGAMGLEDPPRRRRLLLLPLVSLWLGSAHLPGDDAQRVKVRFTPMVCRVHCSEARCTNRCEPGNVTTLYSDHARPAEGAPGFRVFLCPLICQNGGVCLKKDKCLCPADWTGKFCHIPALPHSHGQSPTRRESEGRAEALTKSVYTLPIANHHHEQDGVASMADVHVQHPPEASVTIHRVERVREEPPGDTNTLPLSRPALYSVVAQSSPREPGGGYGENSGFGYCFRQLRGGECSAPLPGLRTREICCRGTGLAWGVHDCQPCTNGDLGDSGPVGRNEVACPKGFQRRNGSCIDVDECQEGNFCHNGDCTNTRGSFACVCHEGYILDSSRSSCISHHVISEAKGPCFRVLREGGCSLPILRNITKQICCCSRVGKAWGDRVRALPCFWLRGVQGNLPSRTRLPLLGLRPPL